MSRLLGLFAAAVVSLGSLPWSADAETPPAPSARPPSVLMAPEGAKPRVVITPEPTGFRVTAVEVVAERDVPQVCFQFSERLDKAQGATYAAFLEVVPVPSHLTALSHFTIVARDNTLCAEGLAHGTAYAVTLRAGLPGADGASLAADERHDVVVPNRAASLAFRGAGYILPRIGAEGLPLRSINVDRARLRVLQIADRKLVETIYAGRVSQTLSDWDVGEMVEKAGKSVWTGDLAIAATRNVPVVTPFPVEAAQVGLDHGVYLAMAEPDEPGRKGPASHETRTSQWFVVSDLGLTSFVGDDGLTVFARSLSSAEPVAGVDLHLLGRNGKELAKRATGPDGIARFEPDVARKSGDETAQALFAYGTAGDFSFLDLAAPGFDLSDRGAGGRTAPGPLDAFLFTDRGVYRPGETINLTALLRTGDATAVTGRLLVLKLTRPDGFEADQRGLNDAGAGSYTTGFTLPAAALQGSWTLTAHLDPATPAIGKAEFTVLDFVPPRLDVALHADKPVLSDGGGSLSIESRYLVGAPAGGLPGELSLTVRAAEAPFPGHPGFHFGLAQEKFAAAPLVLPGFTTNAAGKATVALPATKLPDSSHPLEAVVRGTVYDVGGRPVTRDLVLPVQHQPFAIGVRPRFEDGGVPEGATAGFDVIALAADGSALDKSDLSYELYEEDYDYRWFESNGRWDYETVVRDHRVTGGTLSIAAATPSELEEHVAAGRYRLEVFDAKTGVATSVRFAAGWWVTPTTGTRPDKVEVSVMLPRYRSGETARVHIQPPYDSEVLIAIADGRLRKVIAQRIGVQGTFLDIPVDASWTAGVTIIATAYAAGHDGTKAEPRRAIGVAWLGVDPAPHTLDVKLAAPATSEPHRPLAIGVTVRDDAGAALPPGTAAYLTLSAVDDAVLQATDQTSPDPVAYYLGQRRLGVELRDVYGRLLGPAVADKAIAHPAPPEKKRLRQLPTLPERDSPVVSLYSGIVRLEPDGTARVPLTLPEFDGRLRLTAVAWTADRIGHAETVVTVRDRVAAALSMPRYLAPGDQAQLDLTLTNLTGTPGDYQVVITTEGGFSVTDGRFAVAVPKRGRHVTVSRPLTAGATGGGVLRYEITGPDNVHLVHSRTVSIRAASTPLWRHRVVSLAPGQSLSVPPDLFAGLSPNTVAAALTVSPLPELDLPGLVMSTDRPLKGSAEQLASGVLRLLSGGDTAIALGVDTTTTLRDRTQAALDRLLALQRADGGFAPWSPKTGADATLTPFVLDVLGRARSAGYRVPDVTLRLGQDWLKRLLDNGWFEDRDLPNRAYATYLLAKDQIVSVGAIHYFQETYSAKLLSDLPRAQLAAALAAAGDSRGASEAFEKLTGDTRGPLPVLRELAGIVALGAETGAIPAERLRALAEGLAARTAGPDVRLGIRDKAWLAAAARALADHAPPYPPVAVTIGSQTSELTRALYQPLTESAPPAILNAGGTPVSIILSAIGLPIETPAAAEEGFSIQRSLFDMDGQPVKPDAIRRNQLLVVILDGVSTDSSRQQVVVTDLLPGGLEIENVRSANSAQLGALSWLGELSAAGHIEYRNDRFVAALDLEEGHPAFRVVYLARAVCPGSFIQPGATVEAVSRPSRFARTTAGRLDIHGD